MFGVKTLESKHCLCDLFFSLFLSGLGLVIRSPQFLPLPPDPRRPRMRMQKERKERRRRGRGAADGKGKKRRGNEERHKTTQRKKVSNIQLKQIRDRNQKGESRLEVPPLGQEALVAVCIGREARLI